MTRPLDRQIAGDHYKSMAIQPVELAFANRYDDCIFSTFKYVMRHQDKNGAVDLDKAIHFCHMRAELIQKHGRYPRARDEIPVLRMAFANKLPEHEKLICVLLHDWACSRIDMSNGEIASDIAAQIEQLKHTKYPERK